MWENRDQNEKDANRWNGTVRELIKHENDLVATRLGWACTLQGLLITAFSFFWADSRGWISPPTILCGIGILLAVISLVSICEAAEAIDRLRGSFIKRDPEEGHWPPIWGGPTHDEEKKKVLQRWARNVGNHWGNAPWNLIPGLLLAAWIGLLIFHLYRPRELKNGWHFLAQYYLQTALEQKDRNTLDQNTERAITALSRIHGDESRGKSTFEAKCSECHPNPAGLVRNMNREDVIKSVLYPESTTSAGKICMPEGLTTTLSPEEFINIVEYLDPHKPSADHIRWLPIRGH